MSLKLDFQTVRIFSDVTVSPQACAALARIEEAIEKNTGDPFPVGLTPEQIDLALRESKAWEVFERWVLDDRNSRDVSIGPRYHAEGWHCTLSGLKVTAGSFIGITRIEAIEKAAAWCVAQPS